MNRSQASELLRDRWKSQLGSTYPAYAFDNESYRGTTTWAHVKIVYGADEQRSMGKVGTRRFEQLGALSVMLFASLDVGRDALDVYAQAVLDAFESKHLSTAGDPLWTQSAAPPTPPITMASWFMVSLVVPFSFFSLK